MNIIGEGFPDPIINQVKKRQEIHGSGYVLGSSLRSPKQILYLDANTSWCKLVSSVNIDEPPTFTFNSSPPSSVSPPPVELNTIQFSPESFNNIEGTTSGGGSINTSNSLAKQFILFNGVKDIDKNQRAGIDFTNSAFGDNRAYGIGGTDFGLRPMMGITSANIKFLNRGSIRQAVVKIKAWNTIQFRIIDALYLRLGFSVLLEWGHTMWFDNDGTFHDGGDLELSLASDFLEGKGTYQNFLDKIYKQRLSSKGNYDAMFGKVTNYHWSFLPDGSYNITLDLISIGDVVESFKMNVFNNYNLDTNTENIDNTNGKSPEELPAEEVISLYANSNKIALYFNSLIIKNGKNEVLTPNPNPYANKETPREVTEVVSDLNLFK